MGYVYVLLSKQITVRVCQTGMIRKSGEKELSDGRARAFGAKKVKAGKVMCDRKKCDDGLMSCYIVPHQNAVMMAERPFTIHVSQYPKWRLPSIEKEEERQQAKLGHEDTRE